MKNTASSVSLDVYDLFDKEGSSALYAKLLSLSVKELKAIIAREQFDTGKMTRSWKDVKRLARFILEGTHSRVTHGDAFRDHPRYLGNPKYDIRAINEFDEVSGSSRVFDEAMDNPIILRAYEQTQQAGNERLNFDDVIWPDDIKPIAKMVKMLGLREFTISSQQTSLIDVLAAFQEQGVFIKGTVQVTEYWNTSRHTAAILMEIR